MGDQIVVTGMGVVTPLGCGVQGVWERLIAGKSGIRKITRCELDGLSTHIAGQVPSREEDSLGFEPMDVVSKKDRKKVDLFTLYALAAAEEALDQAGWKPEGEVERERTATLIGTGIGGFPVITDAVRTLDQRGPRRLSPFVVPAFLANLAAGNISIRYGFKGPIGAPVTACAAGLQAIGDGLRMLKSGEADVVLAGGTEACIDRLTIGGFGAAKALSTRNEEPELASRPFDQSRDGFVLGEGAGLVVLETKAHAEARGAEALVEVTGYGTSADAYHLTAGPEDGSGAARAMRACLEMAGSKGEGIDYINAHATSTPVGDRGEVAGMKQVFGERLRDIAISSTKSAVGHLLGAAGGVEAVFTAMAIRSGIVPPTLNLKHVDEGLEGYNLVPLEAQERSVGQALCNAFGFGGVNASLAMKAIG